MELVLSVQSGVLQAISISLVILTLILIFFWGFSCLHISKCVNEIPHFKEFPVYHYWLVMKEVFKKRPGDNPIVPMVVFHQLLCGLCYIHDKQRITRIWVAIRPYILLYKPETVEVVLSSNSTIDKSLEYRFLHPWLGTGLLTSTGQKWRSRRKLLTPSFHFRILEKFIPVINDQSDVLVQKMKHLTHEKRLDIVPLITACALEIICETTMGVSLNAQHDWNSEYVRAIHDVGEAVVYRCARPWLWIEKMYYLFPSGRRYRKDINILHGFTRKGHDTVSMAVCWAMYNIGLRSDVQDKVFKELEGIFDDNLSRPVTSEDLKAMKYLECVIKESMRLYPPVPIIARELKNDIHILNYTLTPGSLCLIFPYMLHRDSETFPNPEYFDPDRFTPENCAGRHPYAFIPFSAGPRNCIGQRFAMMEEKILLAQILRQFEVKSLDHRENVYVSPSMILRNTKPLHLKLLPRNR